MRLGISRVNPGRAVVAVVATLSFGWPVEASERVGGVAGRVVVGGGNSRPSRLPVTKHRSVCGDRKWSEDFLVSRDGDLANVVVTIEGAPAAYRPPQTTAVLDNRECVFVPHVQVAAAGQAIEIRNSDRIIHTAHAYDAANRTLFNVALPVYKRLVRRTLGRPGIYRIACDVGHTWMSAYIAVVDHPYSAVTDRLGGFQISGVPPGTYRLRFWHERLGIREEPLVVKPASEASVRLVWRADDADSTGSALPLGHPMQRAR